MSPSMEKTPSVISSLCPGVGDFLEQFLRGLVLVGKDLDLCPRKPAPSMMLAWFNSSEMMKSSLLQHGRHGAGIGREARLKHHARFHILEAAMRSSSSMCSVMVPEMVRTAPDPTPYFFAASSAASRSLGCVVSPR